MFSLLFKAFFRNLKKNKLFSIINAIGLTTGITAFLVIFSYTQDQRNYDTFHPHSDRLYKVNSEFNFTGEIRYSGYSFAEEGDNLLENLPEVADYVRVINPFDQTLIIKEEDRQYENDLLYADKSFFRLFGFKLKYGTAAEALSKPWSIVITADMAMKYFNREDVVGETLVVNDEIHNNRLTVITGVLESSTNKSHLDFDMLFPIKSMLAVNDRIPYLVYTYLQLEEAASADELQSKLPLFIQDYHPRPSYLQRGITLNHRLEPVSKLYHSSEAEEELSYGIGYQNLNILLGIGLIILAIAAINFVNLITAQFIRRGLEIGVKKAIGSSRKMLIGQFLFETVAFTLSCAVLAIIIFYAVAEPISQIIKIEIPLDPLVSVIAVIVGLMLGIISGVYPALYLSSLKVTVALKQKSASGKSTALLRKALVIFQFSITVFLLIATFIIREQFVFLTSYNGGLTREGVVAIPLGDSLAVNNADVFKKSLLQKASVKAASATSFIPLGEKEDDFYVPEGRQSEENILITVLNVDADFLSTLEIPLKGGRHFERNSPADRSNILVNETMLDYLDWNEAVGRTFTRAYDSTTRQVIGVVEDFNISSLHEPVIPFILSYRDERYPFNHVIVRIERNNMRKTLEEMESTWQSINPHLPFDYNFLSDEFDMAYEREAIAYNLFVLFSSLSILIGCMGLFGLSAFMVQQRMKEVSIRKVLGATIVELLFVLVKEYILLVILACAFVVPIAVYFMSEWLDTFSYKIQLSALLIIWPVLIAIVVALVTVSYNCLRAAFSNPINSLRSE